MHPEPTDQILAERRALLRAIASAAGAALAACATTTTARAGDPPAEHGSEPEVTPGEDLMQEHGVLERILLVYDEGIRRIEHDEALDPSVIARAAGIVRRFVEDYHEKLEEQFVFPRLQAAKREIELVDVLLKQHQRGRVVTGHILELTSAQKPGAELAQAMRAFNRMYRPHAAREDTVVFPAFRDVVGAGAYGELGEQFEDREHEVLGKNGFEGAVKQVAELERALGIYDLAQFTP